MESTYNTQPWEGSLTLADLQHAIDSLGPISPQQWLIRRAGLSDEHNAQLDSLGLPERCLDGKPAPSTCLPDGVLALIFSERGSTVEAIHMIVL